MLTMAGAPIAWELWTLAKATGEAPSIRMRRLSKGSRDWTEGQCLAFDLTVHRGYVEYIDWTLRRHDKDAGVQTAIATRLLALE